MEKIEIPTKIKTAFTREYNKTHKKEKKEEEEEEEEEENNAKKANAANAAKAAKAVKNGIKNAKNKGTTNIGFPGIITSKDIMDTEKELLQQGGRRRRKIRSFLKGGSLIADLQSIGGYLKK